MFGKPKKNDLSKLDDQYARLMESARDLQRRGDIRGYAAAIEEAESIGERIDSVKRKQDPKEPGQT